MDGDRLGDALHEKGLGLPAHQLAVQLLHRRIQSYVRETRNILQLRANCIGSEHFFQGALKEVSPTNTSITSNGSGVSVFQRQS